MGQSHYPHDQTQPLGSLAPIIWYASFPDHVKRLYDHKAAFSQQPIAMVRCETYSAPFFWEESTARLCTPWSRST